MALGTLSILIYVLSTLQTSPVDDDINDSTLTNGLNGGEEIYVDEDEIVDEDDEEEDACGVLTSSSTSFSIDIFSSSSGLFFFEVLKTNPGGKA